MKFPIRFVVLVLALFPGARQAGAAPGTGRQAPIAAPALDEELAANVLYDEPGDGRVWARGATYKASFGQEGFTYVPFLGSEAPRNYPVRMRLESVGQGECALDFARDAAPSRTGDTIAYDRGALVETYTLSPQAIEQKFLLRELPACGDLVLEIAVDSDMERGEDAAGLRFANAHGAVTYGRATAIDARNERWSLPTHFSGCAVRITVPADCRERCALPLLVDPIIGTVPMPPTTTPVGTADSAFDTVAQSSNLVYVSAFSAQDNDVFCRSMDDNVGFGLVYGVDFTTEDWVRPHTAYNRVGGTFLITADAGSWPAQQVKGRILYPGGVLGATFVLAGQFDGGVGPKYYNDLGGDDHLDGTGKWMAVWTAELIVGQADIHGRFIDATGSLGPVFVLGNAPQHETTAAISKRGTGSGWQVVWALETGSSNANIWGRRKNLSSTGPLINYGNGRWPSLSSISPAGSYVVAFENHTFSAFRFIPIILADDTGILQSTLIHTIYGFLGLPSSDWSDPQIDCVGETFLVAFRYRMSSSMTSGELRSFTVQRVGNVISAFGLEIVGNSTAPFYHPEVVGLAGHSQIHRARILRTDGGQLLVTQVDLLDGGVVTTVCPGDGTAGTCPCSNYASMAGFGCANSYSAFGARLNPVGPASVSRDEFWLTAYEMPPGSTCLFFQGTTVTNNGNGAAFGDGNRCVGGSIIRLAQRQVTLGGTASIGTAVGGPSVPAAGMVPTFGGVRSYQVWYRNAANYCTAATFNLTNGIKVGWVH